MPGGTHREIMFMKKEVTIIIAGASLFFPALVLAQWDMANLYYGVRGGVAITEMDSGRLTRELNERGHNVVANVDRRDWGGTAYAGYFFTPYVAAEVGFVRQGRFDASVSGTSSDPQRLARDVGRLQARSGDGGVVAVRSQLPITEQVFLVPRAGLYVVRGEADVTTNGQRTRTRRTLGGGTIGLGATLAVTPAVHLGLMLDQYKPDRGPAFTTLGAQAEWHLGR
jgi:hypothetical protein